MHTDKRILIFSLEFPPYLGGAASYAGNLAVGFSDLGHSVTVVTADRPIERAAQARADARLGERHGIRVDRTRLVPKLYLLLLARAVKRVARTGGFDVILVSDSGAQKSSAFFLGDSRIPIWTVFHGSEAHSYFDSPSAPFKLLGGPSRMRALLARTHGCIAVSEWIRAMLVAKVPELDEKTSVVHHGVALEERALAMSRQVAKAALRLDDEPPVIFSASRLIPDKGQDVLIRAFALLKQHIPDLRLLIGGEGPFRHELERLTESLCLDGAVQFLGYLDREQMVACYRACELFVLPTRFPFESFGLVFLEANACGRTVIAGATAGVSEAVEHGVSGLVVDPLDVVGLSEAMADLLENRERRERLERQALQRVSQQFRLQRMAEDMITLMFSGAS